MILRQMKVALVLVAALMTISIGAKAVGTFQPPNPALRGFVEGCEVKPQPCWYGIVPGITVYEAAKRQFEGLNYTLIVESAASVFYTPPDDAFDTCSVSLSNYASTGDEPSKVVQIITLRDCAGLSSGDIMALWGQPERLSVGISYRDGIIIATTTQNNAITWTASIYEPLWSMSIMQPRYAVTHRTEWRGLAPKWRYCQIEPEFQGCLN